MKKRVLSAVLGVILVLESQSVWAVQPTKLDVGEETTVQEELDTSSLTNETASTDVEKTQQNLQEQVVEPTEVPKEPTEVPEEPTEQQPSEIVQPSPLPQDQSQKQPVEEIKPEQGETEGVQNQEITKKMPQALELNISPAREVNEGEIVTLTGKASEEGKIEGVLYRYIYFDGTQWNEIASMDILKPVTWRPHAIGNLTVALQIQKRGENDSNVFNGLKVNPVAQQAKITGFQAKKEDSNMWNATVKLKGTVSNPLDQIKSYEYLAYDGQYWKRISLSNTLEEVEFIPEKDHYYALCFQIYDWKGKVIQQWFNGYTPAKAEVNVKNIKTELQSNGEYKLSADVKTNDRYAEYRWMSYDIVKDEWKILQDWSPKSTTVWKPEYGAYWIQIEGRTSTGIVKSEIIGKMIEKMYVDVSNIQVTEKDVNELNLKSNVKTNAEKVQYRWMYYDLTNKVWGIIQDWSDKNEAVWKNMEAGSYWIHVEAKTVTGESDQETIGYNVKKSTLTIKTIKTQKKHPGIGLDVDVESNDKDIEYCWMCYDLDKKTWGTIQDWSSEKTAVWYPEKDGTYWIHVKVRTKTGISQELTIGYVVEKFSVAIDRIKVDVVNEKERKLEAIVTTDDKNTEYRWMYYDLEKKIWGLISDWSKENTVVWKPDDFGTYWIHLEARTASGTTAVHTIGHAVEKFYVKLGMLDVYTPDQSNYYIHQIVDSNDPNLTYTYMIYDLAAKQWMELEKGIHTYWYPVKSGDYWIHAVIKGSDGKEYTNTIGCRITFKEFDNRAKEVMRNIIYAVETGGQIYGNAKYDTFCPAFNITKNEKAITIGAGGWYATKAQQLLKLIRAKNPELFKKLDTAGIGEDLDKCDWRTYGSDANGNRTIERDSEKAKCIQKLISTDVGKAVQNQLVDNDMIAYTDKAKALGVTDLKARMFCANIHHLGGYGAMKRVITDCKADGLTLSMNNLWTSMRNHTENLDGNTVGANKYKRRHEKVMSWINSYM